MLTLAFDLRRDSIAHAHPIYRTVFVPFDRSWVQVVLRNLPSGLATLSDDPWSQEDVQRVVSEAGTLPPFRLRLGSGFVRLLLHHALYDGVSLERLLAVLQAAWDRNVPLSPSPAHASTAASIMSSLPAGADAFWDEHLRDAPLCPFPTLTGERGTPSGVAEQRDVRQVLPVSLSELRKRATTHGASVQVLATRAVLRLVSVYTGSPDVTVGLVLNGRHWPLKGIEEVHGPLLNLVPCRWKSGSAEDDSFDVPVKALRQEFGRIFAFQAVGLPSVLRYGHLQNVPFDVLVAYQEMNNLPDEGIGDASMAHEFPLAVEVTSDVLNDRVHLTLRYAVNRLNPMQAQVVLKQLCSFLQQDPRETTLPVEDRDILAIANPDPCVPTQKDHFLQLFQTHVER